jgi:hypothetical protein
VSDDEASRKQDVVFVHGPLDEGEGYHVIRRRDDALEFGEIRAVQEGRPIQGETVRLSPRKEHERLFDVEVLVPRHAMLPRSGPAQVASTAYRENWEAIFGHRNESDLPN